MGRNQRNSLDYFPLDVEIFRDIKIRKLLRYKGGQSFTIYSYLLCYIYQHGYYTEYNDDLPFFVSSDTNLPEDYVKEVVNACVEYGLFDKELFLKNIITSQGIQVRYREICKLNRRKVTIDVHSLLNDENETNAEPVTQVTLIDPEPIQQPSQQPLKELLLPMYTHTMQQEAMCMKYAISPEYLSSCIQPFINHCISGGVVHHNQRDALSHFRDWLKTYLQEQKQQEQTNVKNNRRRATQAISNEPTDYDESF